jgi:general secretion pathway protein I
MCVCLKRSSFNHQARRHRLSSERGFTLIEIVVALAILALAVPILFNLISDNIKRIGFATSTANAELMAQSLLATVGVEIPLHEANMAGDFSDNFRWQLHISPWGDPTERKRWPIKAYEVSTEIFWPDGEHGRSIALTTLRLAPKEPGND